MSRRPGVADRHALLAGGAYPSSFRNGTLTTAGGAGSGAGGGGSAMSSGAQANGLGVGHDSYRTVSPFEQPYSSSSSATTAERDPYAEHGAPKKEHGVYMNGSGAGGESYGGGNAYGNAYNNAYGNVYNAYGQSNGANRTAYGGGGIIGANAGGGGSSKGMGSLFGLRTAEQLEEQNDQHLEGLSTKVRMLRDITVGIGNEVRDSTKDLDTLSEAFNNTAAFLGNTFTRLNHMARRQGGWFCNMMLFLLFVIWIFVFLWWWRR